VRPCTLVPTLHSRVAPITWYVHFFIVSFTNYYHYKPLSACASTMHTPCSPAISWPACVHTAWPPPSPCRYVFIFSLLTVVLCTLIHTCTDHTNCTQPLRHDREWQLHQPPPTSLQPLLAPSSLRPPPSLPQLAPPAQTVVTPTTTALSVSTGTTTQTVVTPTVTTLSTSTDTTTTSPLCRSSHKQWWRQPPPPSPFQLAPPHKRQ